MTGRPKLRMCLCGACGKELSRKPSLVLRYRLHFCNQECQGAWFGHVIGRPLCRMCLCGQYLTVRALLKHRLTCQAYRLARRAITGRNADAWRERRAEYLKEKAG